MKYLHSSHDPVGDEELDALEQQFNIKFPNGYRTFLKQNNGGLAESADERFDDALFLAIGDVPTSLESELYERPQDHLIPFAESLNQDPISFDFANGTIWLQGKKVAESFDDFVSSYLRPIEK